MNEYLIRGMVSLERGKKMRNLHMQCCFVTYVALDCDFTKEMKAVIRDELGIYNDEWAVVCIKLRSDSNAEAKLYGYCYKVISN